MGAMTERTRQAAEAIAKFLADNPGRRRVGHIAELAGCPIRPPREGEPNDWGIVGMEPHCQRVTAALEAAVKLGLVEKSRFTSRGPWFYSAMTKAVS